MGVEIALIVASGLLIGFIFGMWNLIITDSIYTSVGVFIFVAIVVGSGLFYKVNKNNISYTIEGKQELIVKNNNLIQELQDTNSELQSQISEMKQLGIEILDPKTKEAISFLEIQNSSTLNRENIKKVKEFLN